jgi:hypothetical protein
MFAMRCALGLMVVPLPALFCNYFVNQNVYGGV